MAPKRRIADAAAMQSHIAAVEQSEHSITLSAVIARLENDRDLCQRLHFMLTNGAFDKREEDDSSLPAAVTKWRQLPQPVVKELLAMLAPAHAQATGSLKCKHDLLCFLLRVDPSSCIYSRHLETLRLRTRERY